MKPSFRLVVLALLSSCALLHAEDWKTTDNQIYRDVQVIKSETDAVTIVDHDGGALIPLAKLPPDLQKRFHYDPLKAEAAAEARAQADAANAQALQAERAEATELEKKVQAQQIAEQKAAAAYYQALSGTYPGVNFVADSGLGHAAGPGLMDPNSFQGGNVWGHLKSDPIPHYKIGDLIPPPLLNPIVTTPPSSYEINDLMGKESPTSDSSNLSAQLDASKIRLIGKIRSAVAGGYILGSIAKDDNYPIQQDPARPDYELVSDQTQGGLVFLDTHIATYSQNQILDLDVYPINQYTSTSGETMSAFTTSPALARACLRLKQHK